MPRGRCWLAVGDFAPVQLWEQEREAWQSGRYGVPLADVAAAHALLGVLVLLTTCIARPEPRRAQRRRQQGQGQGQGQGGGSGGAVETHQVPSHLSQVCGALCDACSHFRGKHRGFSS
jgi:hypothetical protein